MVYDTFAGERGMCTTKAQFGNKQKKCSFHIMSRELLIIILRSVDLPYIA